MSLNGLLGLIKALKKKVDDVKTRHPVTHACAKYFLLSASLLLFRKATLDVYYWVRSKPPGPHGSSLPLIGDFFAFGKSPISWLVKMPDYYSKYGLCNELMFVSMGFRDKIFINNIELARYLTKSKLIDNRPNVFVKPDKSLVGFTLIENISNSKDNNNYNYYLRRKIFTSIFLNIAQSKFLLKGTYFALDNYIFQEMDNCCWNINVNSDNDESNCKLWYPLESARYIMYNNVFAAIFGQYVPLTDEFYHKTASLSRKRVRNFGILQVIDGLFGVTVAKFIGYMIYHFEGTVKKQTSVYKEWVQNCGMYQVDFDKNTIKKVKSNDNKPKTSDDIDHDKDDVTTVMDGIIGVVNNDREILEKLKVEENSKNKISRMSIDINQLLEDMIVILFVGQDTTSVTAQTGFYILALHLDLQEMIYNELKANINTDIDCDKDDENNANKFNFETINNLHLFRAFIREIIRLSSAPPQGLPRKACKTFKVKLSNNKECIIRKNEPVFTNIVYMNLKEWNRLYDDPKYYHKYIFGENDFDKIYLNAWLDNNGHFKYNTNDSTFGWGNRKCAGKNLAIKELFCMFGATILKYKFLPPNNDASKINLQDKIFAGASRLKAPCGIQLQQR